MISRISSPRAQTAIAVREATRVVRETSSPRLNVFAGVRDVSWYDNQFADGGGGGKCASRLLAIGTPACRRARRRSNRWGAGARHRHGAFRPAWIPSIVRLAEGWQGATLAG